MKSSGDLLYISSPLFGAEANQSFPPLFLLQPSVGLSVSFSLSGLEFLGVRLGQQSCGNRFLSPGTPPSTQTAQLRRETMEGELSPGVPRPLTWWELIASKWGSGEKGQCQPLKCESQNKREPHRRDKKRKMLYPIWQFSPVSQSTTGPLDGLYWRRKINKGMTLPTGNLVSSTTLPQILHSLTDSSIPSTEQLPHQHGWIQPCTGKPLGFLTGREERRVSTS